MEKTKLVDSFDQYVQKLNEFEDTRGYSDTTPLNVDSLEELLADIKSHPRYDLVYILLSSMSGLRNLINSDTKLTKEELLLFIDTLTNKFKGIS